MRLPHAYDSDKREEFDYGMGERGTFLMPFPRRYWSELCTFCSNV